MSYIVGQIIQYTYKHIRGNDTYRHSWVIVTYEYDIFSVMTYSHSRGSYTYKHIQRNDKYRHSRVNAIRHNQNNDIQLHLVSIVGQIIQYTYRHSWVIDT